MRSGYVQLKFGGMKAISEQFYGSRNTFGPVAVVHRTVPSPEHRTAESGIYLLTAIDFILNDVPCIFFLENIKHLRLLLSSSRLKNSDLVYRYTENILTYCDTFNYIDIIYVHMHKKDKGRFYLPPTMFPTT